MSPEESKFISLINEMENFRTHESFPNGINIFEATGMVRQEIKHSNFLGFLLDPVKPHGFGDSFIKSFLVKVAENNITNNSKLSQLSTILDDYSDLVLEREWNNPDFEKNKLRIDIVAWSRKNKSVFVIENKVDAGEGDKQLVNYINAIKTYKNFDGYTLHYIYLTKSGNEASTEPWMIISYEDLLELLEGLLKKNTAMNNEIQLLVTHYIQLIRRNIVQDEKLISECQRIYQQYEDVLDIIFKHGTSRKSELTTFSEASTSFAKKHSNEIQEILKKPRQYVFLENGLFDLLKSFKLSNFFGQEKPILLWFNFRDDNALGLVLEVGPIQDEDVDRYQLVSDLQKLFVSSRLIKDKYTRVWSKYYKISDEASEEDILEVMDKLWIEFSLEIPKVVEILRNHKGICKN